jgi:hypothetical protein
MFKNGIARAFGVLFALALFASSIQSPALAQRRLQFIRVLATCQRASGFVPRAELTLEGRLPVALLLSGNPEGFAGFGVEGVRGMKVGDIRHISIDVRTPKDDQGKAKGNFFLRISTLDNRVQTFTIGPNTNPNLINIPFDPPGINEITNFSSSELTASPSILTNDDLIKRMSFYFSSDTKGKPETYRVQHMSMNDVFTVPFLFEEGNCDELFGFK